MKGIFDAFIDHIEDVHDGDTIDDVIIPLPKLSEKDVDGQVWLDLFVDNGIVHVQTNIRLAGIDAPEIKPRKRLPSGKKRTDEEVDHERYLAQQAKKLVVNRVHDCALHFKIKNPQMGKFDGRTVAQVWCRDNSGKLQNLSLLLLKANLAYPYLGGTKRRWTLDGPTSQPKEA